MMGEAADIASALRAGLYGKKRPDYKDPWDYFGCELDAPPDQGAPVWARHAWLGGPYTNQGRLGKTNEIVPGTVTLTDPGHEIAAVGGKGSAKTYTGGLRLVRLVQKYPGSKHLVAANSYAQVYGSAGVKIVEISNAMGLKWFHRTEMIIDGVKHYNVYVYPDFDSFVCLLSFDNINLIEGTEWDSAWFEEIQDCKQKDVETAVSRLRRQYGDRSTFYAGMPDDEGHWMYSYFEQNGIQLYEPALKENFHNLPPDYVPRLKRMYRGADLKRYVDGERVSLFRSKCLPAFDWATHVAGEMSKRLCQYDPFRKLYITCDFNVSPMCWSLWQMKEYTFDKVDGEGKVTVPVLAQVDEFELWGTTTREMCEAVLSIYGDHDHGMVILGDATGQRSSTIAARPGESDWSIIRECFREVYGCTIVPGVVVRRKGAGTKRKRGERKVTYLNPLERDRVTAANDLLVDGDGYPRVAFLPSSHFPSGGVAKSCASAQFDAKGKIDESNEQSDDRRNLPLTHFFDGYGYLAFYLTGGKRKANDAQMRKDALKAGYVHRGSRFEGAI